MTLKFPRRAEWAATGILLAAVLLLFAPALRHPAYLLYPTFSPYSDVTIIHWPKAHLMAHTWGAARTLPLWTPANLSGMPLAANPLAMRFYPPAWLFLLLPLNLAFNLLFVFHLFWGGLGVYWLLRSGFDLDSTPALAGALTFALGGKLLAHAASGHVSMVGAMAWMPWALLGTHQLLRVRISPRETGHWRWVILAAISLAMQITTHTLITLYTSYFLIAYVIKYQIGKLANWQISESANRKSTTRNSQSPISNLQSLISNLQSLISNLQSPISNLLSLSLSLLSIPALAALLGAAQLLPLIELTGYSNRALSLSQAGEFALTPLRLLVGLFLPDAVGGHEMVIYLGLVPLILALFGLSQTDIHPADRQRGIGRCNWFFGGMVLLAVLFALGPATPLFGLVYRWLPGFRWVRTPARVFLPASLAVAVLAGMGMQRLAEDQRHNAKMPGQHVGREAILLHSRGRWPALAAMATGAFTLALGLGLAALFGQVNRATLGLACFPPLTLLVIELRARRRLSPRLALSGLALLLFADLASFDATMTRFVSPADAFADGGSVAGYLADQPGLFRTYSPSYSLPPHVAARAGLQTADGVEPVHLAAYDRLMASAGGYGDATFSVTIPPFPPDRPLTEAFRDTRPNLRLLGLLNVEYLVTAFPMDWPGLTPVAEVDGTFIYRNEYALPRAWVVPSPSADAARSDANDDWSGQLAALAELGTQTVVTEEYVATVTHYAPDRIEVEARLPKPGLLILGEIWYPGWQVLVDGRAGSVEQVADILRGVPLDAGTHKIAFVYDPASVRWGMGLSLAGVAVLVGWGVFSLWRRSKRSR